MADKVRILYFLEDRVQERFIKALVERVAKEESISTDNLIHDIRSARGGSKVITEFKKFLKDAEKMRETEMDLLIVAIDGNCKGCNERIRQLERYIRRDYLKDRVVYAVPDPHIERWYIMDQRAFKNGVGLVKAPDLPSYKCKKAYYKQVLNQALKDSDVHSLLGGAEYAEKIVDNIEDLDSMGNHNAGFQKFTEDLRIMFRQKMRV